MSTSSLPRLLSRGSRALAAVLLTTASLGGLWGAGCLRFTPFQVDLTDEQRDQTAKNLEKLATQAHSPDGPLRFAFVSDTHDGYANWRRLVGFTNARSDIELVVHGGDLTDFGAQQEYIWAHEVFSRYRAPFFAVAGNHDGLTNGRELYERMFGPDNFSFSYAGVKFVFFNTNTLEWKMESPDLPWLDAQVADAETAVIVTHHPPDSTPHLTAEQSQQLFEILRRRRVSFYLYGHLHDGYETRRVGPTRFIKAPSALDGSYLVLTFDGARMEVERCTFGECEPEPEPPPALRRTSEAP